MSKETAEVVTAAPAAALTQQAAIDRALAILASFDPVVAVSEDHLPRFVVRAAIGAAGPAPASTVESGGIAVLPVYGALMPRSSVFGTGMDGLRRQLRSYRNDSQIAGVVMIMDTPGGTVAGTPETAAEVASLSAVKPVVALVDTLAASAGYWLASQASQIVSTPSGDVGSIGAMALHVDISKALNDFGIKVTPIRSAPFKNEAMPFMPLSDEAKAHLQARVDEAGIDFVKAVADGRRVSQAKVKESFGQGRVYGAKEALSRGMIDRIATLEDVLAGMTKSAQTRARRRSALAFE